MKKIKIIEIKSEIGAGTRGASMGVDAIKIAALDFNSHFFNKYQSVEVPNENSLLYTSEETPYAKRIKGIATMYERISETVKSTLKAEEFPVILSGDHSNAGGVIAGIKMAYPKDRIGVIWLDAHADLHTPYTTPSGNVHGMPLSTALNEDNAAQKTNTPSKITVEYWEKLKNVGGIAPKILYDDLVFIGLRDREAQEDYLIKKNKVKVVTMNDVRKKGTEFIAKDVLQYLRHCKHIFISFDVDIIDPRVSKGTGTPVPGGFGEREVEDLVQDLMQNERVCCFEITEVNPTLDSENVMAEIAFDTLKRVTNYLRTK